MKRVILVIKRRITRLKSRRVLRQPTARKIVPFVAGVSVLFVAAGAFSLYALDVERTEQARQQEAAVAEQRQQARLEQQKAEQVELEKQKAAEKATQDADGTAAEQDTETGQRYATSSDPRSTAYSTTPPKPHPSSFTKEITHAGQFKPGDMIFYNATKDERGYYGGDLIVSPSTLIISRSNPNLQDRSFSVRIPDGVASSIPAQPWNRMSPVFTPGQNSPQPYSGTSWQMVLNYSSLPAPGTYTVQLHSNRSEQTKDAWYYDGFLTVRVVD